MQDKKNDVEETFEEKMIREMQELQGVPLHKRLDELNNTLVNHYLVSLKHGCIKNSELGNIVALLKNNKVVQDEKPKKTEQDEIDELVRR